jgi:diguanylate cyclase (GGDEF)-like protein/PAS domain S-box-containing protein
MRRAEESARPSALPIGGAPPEVLRALFEHSAVGMAMLDGDGVVTHANAALALLLGRAQAEVIGRALADFCGGKDSEAIRRRLDVTSCGESGGSIELRLDRPNRTSAWAAITVSPALVDDSIRFVVVLQDVTERKAIEARLVHQAYHDPLTSLANRELFRERMEHALARCARDGEGVAVLLLDLDNFKAVNDTQGHGAGDRMLQAVARRLQSATRGCDTVARIGGDEFGILLEHLDVRVGAEGVAERVVAALRQPIALDDDRLTKTGGSIGIAIYSGTEGTEELLRNADVAMYEAKLHSPGRWVIFDPAMHRALIDRVTLEADLRRALERCQLTERPHLSNTAVFPAFEPRPKTTAEFSVAYQPIVDLKTGNITGLEALARWTHPVHGAVAPTAFIPVAEASGLICVLGRWVLREACRRGAAWNARRGRAPVTITVNLSARQLELDGLADEVASVLRDTGLEPRHLILEITETVIMQNAEATLARLHELKRLGVGLAIDDFGTGYSSLAYLQRFPVDVVKIDRVFTEEVRSHGEGGALVRTILALAELLSLKTIAEGVEEPAQRDALRGLGCELGQGYLFGRPLGAEDVEAALEGVAAEA